MTAFVPQVGCVDFNHQRGPEVEFWVTEDGQKLYDHNDWSLLPFMALSDGVHALVEDFSYFTLLRQPGPGGNDNVEKQPPRKEDDAAAPRSGASTLFGIACTRQIRSDRLRKRSKSVTRSSVQKSVVVIVDSVAGLGELRTRLGMVTEMWFAQEDFTDTTILKEFQESLIRTSAQGTPGEHFFGLSLREVIHEFRHQTLVLVKCLLLQRKMLFFSSKCERLCLLQFALLSLLPGLMSHLETAAHPDLEITERSESSGKKSARAELLESFGQPLPIFCRGGFWCAYTPLQHLDMLAAYSTKSYVVGSTNSLLLQQQSRYADIMVNLDTEPYSITIFSPSLKKASTLSAADRRWIDNLTQQVLDTWDPENPARPKNHGYAGSEEMIRLQFEEYILSLCSCMAYQVYRERTDGTVKDVLWKDEGQESGVVSTRDEPDAPELQEIHNDEVPPEKPPRPGSTASNVKAQTATQTQPQQHHQHHQHRTHLRTSSLDAHLPPADLANNALDFRPEFLADWRQTRNFELFIASLPFETLNSIDPNSTPASTGTDASKRPRIFDLIPASHPTAGGLNIDDVQRRLQQGLEDFRVAYKVDERLGQTRENVGKAIEAGREKWGKWWTDMEERRRRGQAQGVDISRENSRPGSIDAPRRSADAGSASAATAVGGATAVAGTAISTTTSAGGGTSSSGGGAGGAWTAAIRERAAKVQQMQKPDTAVLQQAAKENAAKAGAYLSSWGSWAKEKSRDWQTGGGTTAAAAATTAAVAVKKEQPPAQASSSTVPTVTPTPTAVAPATAPSAGTDETNETDAAAAAAAAAKPQRQSVGKFKEDID